MCACPTACTSTRAPFRCRSSISATRAGLLRGWERDACRTAARLGARPAPECHAAEQTSLAGSRITRARFGSEGGHRLFRSPALRKGGPQAALGRRKKAGIPRALSKRRMPAYKVRGRALLNALTYAEEDKGKRVAARKESRHPGIPPRRVSGPPKALDGAERPRPQWPQKGRCRFGPLPEEQWLL